MVVLDNLSTGFRQSVPGVTLVEGDVGDAAAGGPGCLSEHGIHTVIHFAAHTIVPESVADPLKYYGNNTCQTRSLLATCLRHGVQNFVFSSTAAVYGIPASGSAPEDAAAGADQSLRHIQAHVRMDAARCSAPPPALRYVVLRYFNVAGSDPQGRIGQSTRKATLLVKVACEASVGKRESVSIFGTDYPTPDGTGVRDYIHVEDLARAHLLAVDYLRDGGAVADAELRLRPRLQRARSAAQRGTRAAAGRCTIHEHAAPRGRPARPWSPRRSHPQRARAGSRELDDLDGIVASSLRWEEKLLRNPGNDLRRRDQCPGIRRPRIAMQFAAPFAEWPGAAGAGDHRPAPGGGAW